MPNYDYLCPDCGPFSAFKPIAQYQDPQDCPTCAAPSPRTILRAPAVQGISGGSGDPAWLGGMKKHGGGCACC